MPAGKLHPAENMCRMGPVAVFGALSLVVLVSLVPPALAQLQFPGPTNVDVTGEALSSISLNLEPGEPHYLLTGTGPGMVTMFRLNPSGTGFQQVNRILAGGSIVHMVPWEGRPLVSQGIVAATVNPDRLLFIRVLPQAPYFTIEDEVLLEEDPGTISFIGDLAGDAPEMAVSLPGIDRIAFLKEIDGSWELDSTQMTGDQPHSLAGLDLDGDQVRELVVANRGYLAGTLAVYRRDEAGDYISTLVDFSAGFPGQVASYDLDEDGKFELAVTVLDRPEVVLMRDVGGQLVEFETIALTLPADSIHLTNLFDGTPGLFAGNSDRGLVDFFQHSQGAWIRRNSYYPGCYPLGMASGDLNGDGGRDLISMGGDAEVVTVLFANPQPGFWGYPALALTASPSSSTLADFDGDGWPDLAVANGDQPLLSFFQGLSGGGFEITSTDIALTFYPGQVAAINTDEDPKPELAILDGSGDRVLVADFLDGQGFLIVSETPTGNSPRSVSAADIDNDGYGDLLVMTREAEEVQVFFGAGNHSFPAMTNIGLENLAYAVVSLDLNGDRLGDLALTDGVNRVWTSQNLDGRSFGQLTWLNAGSGAGVMAVGDLDNDQDDDLIVVNKSDASLTLFENTLSGVLTRRIGAHTLNSAPSMVQAQDMDGDGLPEIIMNLREERVLGVSFAFGEWDYSVPSRYEAGPDVTSFDVDDFNDDDVPDILTLDRSLKLGLTLLNVDQDIVAVVPEALEAACSSGTLEIRIQPDRQGSWSLEFVWSGGRQTLVADGRTTVGTMDYDRGVWILDVKRGELAGPVGAGLLRLTVGEADRRETLDLPLEGYCAGGPEVVVPRLAWAREPWPNPFNPLVNARFSLSRAAEVRAGIYDLSGRRIAVLAEGWFASGDHPLQWNGKQDGRSVGAGVYLLRIVTPEETLHHKVMLIK